MLCLNKDVYRVCGIKGSIVYDFNKNVLYHLNFKASQLLNSVLDCSEPMSLQRDSLDFIQNLKVKGILTNQYTPTHDISDLIVKPVIDFVWIEITTACNLRCVHCYDNASPANENIMNYPDFCRVVDELVKNKIKKVQIIGGEPFILGNTLKLYLDYCVGKFEYLEIFTNGTLINNKWITYLKEKNISVALSVYSYIEEEHNKVTKNSTSYQTTNENIEKLGKAGIKYRVKNVLMADLNLGTPNTSLYTLNTRHDIVRMVGRADLGLLTPELIKRKLITPQSFTAKPTKQLVSRMASGHNCFSRRLYFSTNLEIFPCVMERRISHGNLKDNDLQNLIKQDILQMTKDHVDGCSDCEFRYSCFDCRPDALGAELRQKPWYCTYNPYLEKWEDVDEFISKILFQK